MMLVNDADVPKRHTVLITLSKTGLRITSDCGGRPRCQTICARDCAASKNEGKRSIMEEKSKFGVFQPIQSITIIVSLLREHNIIANDNIINTNDNPKLNSIRNVTNSICDNCD
eukprot:867374_1